MIDSSSNSTKPEEADLIRQDNFFFYVLDFRLLNSN